MFDLLKVSEIYFPKKPKFTKDDLWVEFGGEKPISDNGDELVSYEELLTQAQLYYDQGLMAEWGDFIEDLPQMSLVNYVIINRTVSQEVHHAITDILILMALPQLRIPPLIMSFWISLLTAIQNSPLDVTKEMRDQWNLKIDEYNLPDDLNLIEP